MIRISIAMKEENTTAVRQCTRATKEDIILMKYFHIDWVQKHGGKIEHCGGKVNEYDETMGHFDITVKYADGTVDHFARELNSRPL